MVVRVPKGSGVNSVYQETRCSEMVLATIKFGKERPSIKRGTMSSGGYMIGRVVEEDTTMVTRAEYG